MKIPSIVVFIIDDLQYMHSRTRADTITNRTFAHSRFTKRQTTMEVDKLLSQNQTMELQYELQNHDSPFGLYGPLNEKLNFYRSKLDTWVDHQKELADKVAEEHKAAISKKQTEIDYNATSLLALTMDESLHVDGKENSRSVQERVDIEQQRVETLQKQLEGKKEELEGKQ